MIGQRRRGLTLIELLVASSMGIIISGVVGAIFVRGYQLEQAHETTSSLQQQARFTVDQIADYARQAKSVVPTYTANSQTYTTSSNQLVLQLPSLDSSANILPASDYIVFRLRPSQTTTLEEITLADGSSSRANRPTIALANAVGSITLTYYDSTGNALTDSYNNTTQLGITVQASQSSLSRSFTTRVALRNK